ncbi:SAR2788 family putative toxin [Pseudobacillus wudalianchiensis]|uniref:Bacterial EndoU nuclease domain-containing protein n=1 Tax=Pseudobacillus wudalianchiensis TaxID=1743143 RepID=A0A1B9AYZ7_9BACI|nr:SAR2788 family putative toxin [Bacillus wudalianchiensis]OCA89054.1 hypothetical protein A8F95_06495 [Bacillus wudalianchiensis]
MKRNKFIIKAIVVCMLVWILPDYNQVKAASNHSAINMSLPEEDIADMSEELNEELNEDLDLSQSEELDIEVVEADEENIVVESNYHAEDLKANFEIEMNLEANEFLLTSKLTENGESTKDKYAVYVTEADDNSFKGTFVNVKTGERHEVNTEKLQASAIPVIVYIIGAAALRVTIQYIGKKAILKIGKKTFQAVSSSAAKKATVNFVNASVNVGSKSVQLTKSKMQHILKNHHPNYWTGSTGKSMFDPDLNVNDVKNIVMSVIRSNKKDINSSLKSGKGINVQSKVNGVKYEVRINKDGYVSSAYPVK